VIEDTLVNILLITLSGVLINVGVHFIPVGGAPAAMAQATGIGTGTVELAAGSGLTGLLVASYMYANIPNAPLTLILASGAVGSMIMIASAMFAANLIYAYAVGVPFASAVVKYDPLVKLGSRLLGLNAEKASRQDTYMSKGTAGQGLPFVCFISGVIGGSLGGIGGSMIYFVLIELYKTTPWGAANILSAAAVAGVFAFGVYYVNAVIPSYAVGGTIEGFHDPKFRKIIRKATLTSFTASLLCAIAAVLIAWAV
jgi:tetrahydromethanopterin S-methyltransferase subunit D